MEVFSDSVPVFMAVAAIGGMALTPLYIKEDQNREAIQSLNSKLDSHIQLDGHPVMKATLTGEVKRLDERISGLSAALEGDIKMTNDLAASFGAHKAETESKFVEIETQMDSSAQSLGIQFANTQRELEDFQNAFHELGVRMSIAPTGPFYVPNISNRNPKK